jgi:hypothetical protein
MSLKTVQGDEIFQGMGIAKEEVCRQRNSAGHAYAAFDALWNRCERSFMPPAMSVGARFIATEPVGGHCSFLRNTMASDIFDILMYLL